MALAIALLCSACSPKARTKEVAYVTAPQVYLRDRVAAIYNKVALLKNGDQVEVLERARRFVRVRTAAGQEGWVEQRYLIGPEVFDGLQKLAADSRDIPVQATGIMRSDTNMHLTAGRDTEHLYQLGEGNKVDILKRTVAEKTPAAAVPVKADIDEKREPAKPVLEDWWLVRDSQGRVGWVLSRMVDLDLPLEVAQYAEGQRVVGAFVLNRVHDAEKDVPQYLMMLTEPRDGMPFDFNQIRVFTWNLKRHRYETAYRERSLFGLFPVVVKQEPFDKEGVLPVFIFPAQDNEGKVQSRKYKLNTPIVRRVLSPEEQQALATNPPPKRSHSRRRR